MRLLNLSLGAVEKPRLTVMIREGFGAQSCFGAFHRHRETAKPAFRIFAWPTVLARLRQAVRFVVGTSGRRLHLHVPIALEILERAAFRPIDQDLVEVDQAEA